jgi:oxazoline/thiazoline synthase
VWATILEQDSLIEKARVREYVHMLKRPRFKHHWHVETVPGEGVFLLSASKQILLRGRLYEIVVPWVGQLSAHELCEHLQNKASAAEVYFVLEQLEQKGYLCEDGDGIERGEAIFWSEQQIAPKEATRRLAKETVAVQAFGIDGEPFCKLLQSHGVRIDQDGRLGVVLVDNYLRSDLQAYNSESLKSHRPWVLVKPIGLQIWVGPMFRPGTTACWECLVQRLKVNSPVDNYLTTRGRRGILHTDRGCTVATMQIAWGLVANAVATWIVSGSLPALEGKIQTFDVPGWQMQSHTVIVLPYCPACGHPDKELGWTPKPIVLRSCRKTHTHGGGHRIVPPETTLERFNHHLSAITGTVSMLERVGRSEYGAMHVYRAGHNLARRHRNLECLRQDMRHMSAGKGISDVEARASALCEGLERYSGVFQGHETRRCARFYDLGGAAILLNDCLLFSDSQYRERDAWNAKKSRYNFVPVPLDLDRKIDWSPVWSLTRQEVRYLPTAYCYFNYPQPTGQVYCIGCSNGNAAGNSLEEAILHGLLELVERDAVALWWYNRIRPPGIDLSSFEEPYIDEIQTFLRTQKRDLWVLDLTTDLNIPVFAAISRQIEGYEQQIVMGFGAHLDVRVALLRAITEMNQFLSGIVSVAHGKSLTDQITDPETVNWLQTATVESQPYLVPDRRSPPRNVTSFPGCWSDDIAEDIRTCQSLVESRGMEILVLDQTRQEIGLPVVKVIVPGLRHFWARFAPGRLYDVPVHLGWLSQPFTETQLNPIPMFL